MLIIDQYISIKENIEDDMINEFIANPYSSSQPTSQILNQIIDPITYS